MNPYISKSVYFKYHNLIILSKAFNLQKRLYELMMFA